MTSTSSRRLLVGAFALIASASTGAAVAHAVSGPQATDQQSTAVPATATTATAVPTTALRASSMVGPLSATEAIRIAERQGSGRATEVDAETEATGKTYEVKVLRPGGAEVKVVVDATTGRVLSTKADDADVEDAAGAQTSHPDSDSTESGSEQHDH